MDKSKLGFWRKVWKGYWYDFVLPQLPITAGWWKEYGAFCKGILMISALFFIGWLVLQVVTFIVKIL
jgi:hypothetical protein